ALAVALGLAAVAASPVSGVSEASVRALTKLEQVLPARLRRRHSTLKSAVTRLGIPGHAVDPQYLTDLSAAITTGRQVSFDYERADGRRIRRLVEPYHLVDSGQRWYLVAWDTTRQDWRTFRVDRIRTRPSERARYQPRSLPEGDAAAYVQDAISRSPYRYDFTVRLFAPAAEVSGWVSAAAGEVGDEGEGRTMLRPGWGDFDEVPRSPYRHDLTVRLFAPAAEVSGWVSAAAGEVIDEGEGRTILRTGWDDFDEFLGYLFSLDVPFEFLAPESAIRRVRTISAR